MQNDIHIPPMYYGCLANKPHVLWLLSIDPYEIIDFDMPLMQIPKTSIMDFEDFIISVSLFSYKSFPIS